MDNFYPRSPCGERPLSFNGLLAGYPISIHALLAESDTTANEALQKVKISIHALLAESDYTAIVAPPILKNFYPRSPCGERLYCHCSTSYSKKFLSTLSLRRATGQRNVRKAPPLISIHALLAESDAFLSGSIKFCNVFLSTLSLRRATNHGKRGTAKS